MQFNYRGLLSISILGPPLVPIELNQAPVEHERTDQFNLAVVKENSAKQVSKEITWLLVARWQMR